MLPKEKRLKRKEFSAFLASPSRNKSSKFFSLRAVFGSEKKQFSIVVSKKVAKNATDRNLLKRRFYEVIKKIEDQFSFGRYVFFVKSPAREASFSEIKEEITKMIQ